MGLLSFLKKLNNSRKGNYTDATEPSMATKEK